MPQNRRNTRDLSLPTRVQPLSRGFRDIMLAGLLRCRGAFNLAKTRLSLEHFPDTDYGRSRRELWLATVEWDREHGQMPDEEQLQEAFLARIEELGPEEVSPEAVDDVDLLVQRAFRLAERDLPGRDRLARRLLAQVLKEHSQQELAREVSGRPISNLPAILERYTQQTQSIVAVEQGSFDPVFTTDPYDDLEEARELVPTGLDFIDMFLGGGMAKGELVGMISPVSTCKTLLSCQLGVLAAEREQMIADQAGRPPQWVYLVFWEAQQQEVKNRLLTYRAHVHADLVAAKAFGEMSHRDPVRHTCRLADGEYKDYERRTYRSMFEAGIRPPGEWERYVDARQMISRNICIIDLTGRDRSRGDAPYRLAEGVEEVIRAHQEHVGNPGVAFVAMDYALAAAKLHCNHRGWEPGSNTLSQVILDFVADVSRRIAIGFECRAWVMQQLTFAKNNLKVGVLPDLSNSAGSTGFGATPDVVFVTGTDGHRGGTLFVLGCPKQRRGQKMEPIPVERVGEYALLRRADDRYGMDGDRIVPLADLRRFADVPVIGQQQASMQALEDRQEEEEEEMEEIFRNRDIGI